MLKQACVSDLRQKRLSRADGYIVLAMRRYPRGISKQLRDEYLSCLGPNLKLLDDLHRHKKTVAHNEAFDASDYEDRFDLDAHGRTELERLVDLSRTRDVYLICQCGPGEKCHRELLLLMAKRWYKARIQDLRFRYPAFERRLAAGKG